jgi:glutathione S-transferase
MSKEPIVYGASYSVYVRACRLALEEKCVPYRLVEVDIFDPAGPPPEHLQRHPFGRIPAFEHDGFSLYEAAAIERYIDEAFEGPRLQPSAARDRARMVQIISILDSYAYRPMVWDIYVERVSKAKDARPVDEQRIASALPKARQCLQALYMLMGPRMWLAAEELSLADLHAAPILAYFAASPEGCSMIAAYPTVRQWWTRVASRSSMQRTRPEGAPG